MKKYMMMVAVGAIALVPAIFADTSTGTVTTSPTASGTTNTGATASGTVTTSPTTTGSQCSSGTGSQGTQAAVMLAQQALSTEMARLVSEKKTAYDASLSLSGATQVEAMRAANVKFQAGFKVALKTFQSVKESGRSDRLDIKNCKKEDRKEKHKEKKEQKEENKSAIKGLKNQIKEMRKNQSN